MEEKTRAILKGIIATASLPKLISTSIMLLIGLFIIFVSVMGFKHQITYIETTGTIVDIKEEDGVFYPMYEFSIGEKKILAKGFPETEKVNIQIGKQDTISYNPDDPTIIDIGSSNDGYMTFGIGIIILILSGNTIYSILSIVKQ